MNLNLYRVSWAESWLAFRVESGKENFANIPLYPKGSKGATGYKTQAVSPKVAVRNSQDKNPQFYDQTWRVAQIEQYNHDTDKWEVIQKLEQKPSYFNRDDREGRDYPSGRATNNLLIALGTVGLIATTAYLIARRS